MRKTGRAVQQVTGDENPIRSQSTDPPEDRVVPRQILVEVEITDLYGSSAGQGAVAALNSGNGWLVKPVLPEPEPSEELIERSRDMVRRIKVNVPMPAN